MVSERYAGGTGARPVTTVKGGIFRVACAEKRSNMRAAGIWSDQWESGYLVRDFCMTSLMVRIVLSAMPFALLFPTVMRLCLMPMERHNLLNSPSNSFPLSVVIHAGFPHLLMMADHKALDVFQLDLDFIGTASTHRE